MASIKLKRRRTTGSLQDALLIQWRALKAAQEALYAYGDAGDLDGILKAVHAITQAAQAYSRLTESADMQKQLDALQEELGKLKEGAGLRRVA